LEGDLDDGARLELERHIGECPVCSSEIEILRQADLVLKKHPEVFHPDEADIFRFASEGVSPEPAVEAHLRSCEECGKAARAIADWTASDAHQMTRTVRIPDALARRLDRLYAKEAGRRSFSELIAELVRVPFRAPALALSTVAALVVVAVLAVPVWRSFETRSLMKVPLEDSTVSMPGEGTLREEPSAVKAEDKDYRQDQEPSQQAAAPAPIQREPKLKRGIGPAAPLLYGKHPLSESDEVGGVRKPAGEPAPSPEIPLGDSPREPSFSVARRVAPQALPEGAGKIAPVRERAKFRDVPVAGREREESRARVQVRITDPEGNSVPWIRFEAPGALKERYTFLIPAIASKDGKESVPASTDTREAVFGPGAQTSADLVVRIVVERTGEGYHLTAVLSGGPSGQPRTTQDVSNVSRERIEVAISSLVTSLLTQQ
jgi:hypothetical protein